MRAMTATQAKQNFGTALDAAQAGPVAIRKHDRTVAVLISVDEYDKLRGLRIAAFMATSARIAAAAKARGLTAESVDDLMGDVS
jgi:prevent-host-death family protein